MTHSEFCIWLRGFFDNALDINLNKNQIKIIKNHLDLAETISGKLPERLLILKKELLKEIEDDSYKPENISILRKKMIETVYNNPFLTSLRESNS